MRGGPAYFLLKEQTREEKPFCSFDSAKRLLIPKAPGPLFNMLGAKA